MPIPNRRIWSVATIAALAAVAVAASPAYAAPNNNTVKKLTNAVTAEGVQEARSFRLAGAEFEEEELEA